jgi:CAAX protease family protein
MTDAASTTHRQATPQLVAPIWHTLVCLTAFAALAILGWLAQARSHATNQVGSRLITLQMQAIIFEWTTLAWVWLGARRKKIALRELVGGRWRNAGAVFVDLSLGAGLWLLWISISRIENMIFGHAGTSIAYPSTLIESLLAIAVAISAGFCEEIVFRGYFQKQFWALSGSAGAAVILQAAVFGVPHVYQGVRLATEATLYGMAFGALAQWRGSLRPGILAHAWSDIAARLLRM